MRWLELSAACAGRRTANEAPWSVLAMVHVFQRLTSLDLLTLDFHENAKHTLDRSRCEAK